MEITDVLDEFLNNYNKLNNFSKVKQSEMSKVDVELSDFYHKVEGIHLSHNTQGHSLIVQLKDILDRRRDLKRDTMLLNSFIDSTQSSMDKAKSRSASINDKHTNLVKSLKKNAK